MQTTLKGSAMKYCLHSVASLMLILISSGCTVLSPHPSLAHLQPDALNEAALTALAAGDRSTAIILLRRALRLAPSDSDIAENLRLAEQGNASIVQGAIPRSDTGIVAKPTSVSASTSTLPPLPNIPIWPAK